MSSGAIRGKNGPGRLGNVLSGLAVAVGCVLFLGGFAWGAVVYQPFTVPTDSMQPTVDPGDRVLAERIHGDQVRRGDVVVFQDPAWGDTPMVKRVVGVGGDTVACCDKRGRLTVNGTPVDEPYLYASGRLTPRSFFPRTKVPAGRLFLLGDNRGVSDDSRVHLDDLDHGAVPASTVKARVDAIAWPTGRIGELARPAAFAALPGGVSRPGPITWVVTSVAVGAMLVLGGAAYGPVARSRERRRSRRRVPAQA
ncbi:MULTISPECIES: signal peptidase I [Streptomycetaceae]|uniref:Signal peptidase I n=1 Tax=Streptantibioticus cattleyicolor (strain ATCC 35852 / DSM 46488 / JCM 4925 / NBRC 14057 / NRRL 8057) TaxID=1003195 RepID=F8JTP0_STREN|nr:MULTISPECIES: signal peptidase I [Streptomycetaceae]AEW96806.1 signal peptidase I [Streptantibioticus cattleyicolor NRRL 8057 = DSM 46488]MYS61288.1 signal peptidase I [Streptomyces sp. SID5468]CCB77137.1 putative signal peptidase I [Streptantibioticus cattleyicolor NRRL 8057 = DSM 46488]